MDSHGFPWSEALFFGAAVYGLSWLVTRARISAPLREWLRPVPFLGSLVRCIVCTGVWITLGMAALLPWTRGVPLMIRVTSGVDLLLLIGFNVTFLWLVGRFTGDAD